MPTTKLGKWAGGLLVVFLVSFIAVMDVAQLDPGTGTPLTLIWMVAGIATFVTAAVSLIKFKDRSAIVALAAAIGGLAWPPS